MTKAATLPLGLSFLLATAPLLFSQVSPQQSAVGEGLRRQAARKTLRDTLDNARAARVRGDLAGAAKLYDAAWDLVQYIGTGVEAEAEVTKAGLATVRLELARRAQHSGDLQEANTQIKDLLRVDPHNLIALQFQHENQRRLEEQKGHIPSKEVTDQIPAIADARRNAATLVQDARVFLEMKRLDEAEAKLKQAIKEDPQNQSAYYYMNLVNEARYDESQNKRDAGSRKRLVDIEDAWQFSTKRELLPVPNSYARTNLIFTSKG